MSIVDARILAANQRFYDAFASFDLSLMDSLWAKDVAVACVHPGWAPLEGRVVNGGVRLAF